MIADAQALTDNADNPEKVRQNVIEVALDIWPAVWILLSPRCLFSHRLLNYVSYLLLYESCHCFETPEKPYGEVRDSDA